MKTCQWTISAITVLMFSVFSLPTYGDNLSSASKVCQTERPELDKYEIWGFIKGKKNRQSESLQQDSDATRKQCRQAAEKGDASAQNYAFLLPKRETE